MRVISGTAKGRKLYSPKGLDIRPTSDMVKESLFNMLNDKVQGCNVLDIFAGSGSIGIEALSRGANSVVFIDSSQDSVSAIKKNLELTGLPDRANIIRADALTTLSRKGLKGSKFELIFLDPPYKIDSDVLNSIFISLLNEGFLRQGSLIILEHSSKRDFSSPLEQIERRVVKKYGDQAISIFEAI
ncbi:MAG: 16S rRNA (guanine(966)-N(2))-methyltransferase RsmD [Actinomycetota bacterium]|nr:16S rRNA (guanine(966)-N(2))-methyltransferase RsmD [Actinomycetota bacterium]